MSITRSYINCYPDVARAWSFNYASVAPEPFLGRDWQDRLAMRKSPQTVIFQFMVSDGNIYGFDLWCARLGNHGPWPTPASREQYSMDQHVGLSAGGLACARFASEYFPCESTHDSRGDFPISRYKSSDSWCLSSGPCSEFWWIHDSRQKLDVTGRCPQYASLCNRASSVTANFISNDLVCQNFECICGWW